MALGAYAAEHLAPGESWPGAGRHGRSRLDAHAGPVRRCRDALGQRMDLGDLTEYGLPVPEEGVFSRIRRLGVVPTIVDEEVIAAIKARRFDVVSAVEGFDPRACGSRMAIAWNPTRSSAPPAIDRGSSNSSVTSAFSTNGARHEHWASSRRLPGCASSAMCRGLVRSVTWPGRPSARHGRSTVNYRRVAGLDAQGETPLTTERLRGVAEVPWVHLGHGTWKRAHASVNSQEVSCSRAHAHVS